MNNCFICSFVRNISSAYAELEYFLNPHNYLYCETEEELISEVKNTLLEGFNSGDILIENYNDEFYISDKFIDKWNELKRLENSL